MARRNKGDEEANMDSLLDALTNVVGILLLVLILTSITMSDVVDRIVSELKPVSPEELQANILTRDKRLEDKANLKDALQKNRSMDEIAEQQKQLKLELESLKSDNSVEDLENQMKALELAIKQEQEKKEQQSTENLAKNEELRKLREQLAVAMSDTGPEPTVVSLPNPRIAPDNAEPRYVLCVRGKAYWVGDVYIHAFRTRDLIDAAFEQLVYSGPEPGYYTHGFSSDKKDREGRFLPIRDRDDRFHLKKFRYDPKKVLAYAKANPDKFGNSHISYSLAVPTGRDTLTLRFIPREDGGVTIDELRRPNSSMLNAFKQTGIDRNYLMFHVAPDSFDVYIAARDLANSLGGGNGIPNGWKPWSVAGQQAPVFLPPVPEAIKIKRQFTDYDFAGSFVPRDKLLAHAAKLKPMLEKHAEAANAEIAKAKPDVKATVEIWARRHDSPVSDVTNHIPKLAGRDVGRETIVVSPQVPSVPHIFLFRAFTAVPTEPPPPPKQEGTTDKSGGGNETKGGAGKDTLD